MNHASLFSGIGGFDLAAEWMGWNNILSCEMDPFCNKVLKHHFPNALHFGDIKQLKFKRDESGQLWVMADTESTGLEGARSKEALEDAGRNEKNSLPDAFAQPGTTSQLNHRFVAEMMGFPVNWTELPFLSSETNQ